MDVMKGELIRGEMTLLPDINSKKTPFYQILDDLFSLNEIN